MNELDNKWLNDIRDTMSDYSEPLPENGWKALSASLDAKACPQISPKRGRDVMHTVQRWAAAAMFVAFFSVWCDMPSEYNKLAIEIADINNYYTSNIDEIAASISGNGGTTNKLIAFNRNDNNRQDEDSETRKETTEQKETTGTAEMIDEQAHKEETSLSDTAEKENQSNTVTAHAPLSSSNNEKRSPQVVANNKRRDAQTRNDNSWAMGLHFGGNGMDMGSAGGEEFFGNINTEEKGDMFEDADNDPIRDEVLSSNDHTSFSIGVSLSKSLTDKLSVVTGLIYTNLRSEVEMSLSGYQDQSLNYIGVPIGLRYDIIELGNWSIYGTGGTTIERCLSAKRGDEKLSISKWQFSINGGAGCHYRIGKHLGIYAEPGIRYYFDDKSGVPSIRTEHRCSFNMMIGVRFSY